MFSVLVVQALLFADGGVTALLVNTFNLAVIPVTLTHLLRVALTPRSNKYGALVAAGLGTLLGNLVGALSLASLLVLGAGAPGRLTFTWLLGVQGLAGLAEGLLAMTAVRYLMRRAPALMADQRSSGQRALDERVSVASAPLFGLSGILLLVGLSLLLVPFASGVPDALEVVVERWGQK
jgi:cobalt/nickel transport system permease protein